MNALDASAAFNSTVINIPLNDSNTNLLQRTQSAIRLDSQSAIRVDTQLTGKGGHESSSASYYTDETESNDLSDVSSWDNKNFLKIKAR
jgi:hypothetical protein